MSKVLIVPIIIHCPKYWRGFKRSKQK